MPAKRVQPANTAATPVGALRHDDKRVNIPTGELRGLAVDDEQAPEQVRYPRDPSLDPQLVWRGKDEQDSEDLAVPSVPIYVQEKIVPQAIVETDYDEESFFVRHAYFTGADEPYRKLQRALRADIDADAWSTLYCTRAQPFRVPLSGKIAVKVINLYGDEVLKVYEV